MSSPNEYNRSAESRRLDRIEEKIDKLTDAMISIARVEEKMSSIEEDKEIYWENLNKLTAKVDILEKQTTNATKTIGIIHKLCWLVVTGAFTYYIPTMLDSLPL